MRSSKQRISMVEGVAALACVPVRFIFQPQCPIRLAQYPGADRAENTGQSFWIAVEEICQMVMLFVVVEGEHAVGVLQNLSELARIKVTSAGKSVSRDQQVTVACCLRDVQHLFHPLQGLRDTPLVEDTGRQSPENGR